MISKPSPRKKWELTEPAFSRFLAWLDPDAKKAGEKYEEIRRKLIKIFVCRGCPCPEELSDETINRVIRKVQDIGEIYVGDPALYFFGVAHKVHLEFVRKRPQAEAPPIPEQASHPDRVFECLEHCMERLTARARDLVIQYYSEDKHAKIDLRKQLALNLGIPLNALRIRVHRIRGRLESCVNECLGSRKE